MLEERLIKTIVDLAQKSGINDIYKIKPILGGRNNRLYRVESQNQHFVVKHYFKHCRDQRDRLKTEFSFLQYAWQLGIKCIPQPINFDKKNALAFYEFIDGRKLTKEEIDENTIHQSLDFICRLNRERNNSSAIDLSEASEACFSAPEHLQAVEQRLKQLDSLSITGDIDSECENFLKEKLGPVFEQTKKLIIQKTLQNDYISQKKIKFMNRILSPSDFGFHNALSDQQGIIHFIDFEYAGWDDPVKMICDFFSQPEIPVPEKFLTIFLNTIQELVTKDDYLLQRVHLLLPLHRIKWCCIMLNVFLSADSDRRFFATGINQKKMKISQLSKTIHYFNNYFKI